MDIQKAIKICQNEIANTYAENKAIAIATILSELDKKDKIIDKLLTEITAVNSGRYEYMDNDKVLEIFTKKAEGN